MIPSIVPSSLLLLLLHLACANAQLQLHAAGLPPSTPLVDVLSGEMNICLDDYPAGINIGCKAGDDVRRVTFLLDGKFHRADWAAPFFLVGNRADLVKKWTPSARSITIACKLPAASYTASLTFTCDVPSTPSRPLPFITPAPRPAAMFFRAARYANERQVAVVKNMRFCPERDLGVSDFSVYCHFSDTSKRGQFRLNGSVLATDRTKPYYIGGDDVRGAKPWTEAPRDVPFSLSCNLGGIVSTWVGNVRITCKEPEPLDTTGCIVIPATKVARVPGWTLDDDGEGVTFNEGNRSKRLTRAGVSTLFFNLTAPVTSRYAVVVDMTTRGRADYNDVYMRFFPRGLQLRNGDSTRTVRWWIKGYHSFFGRGAKLSSQVDHKPHSVCTAAVLDAGSQHAFGISGRSNQVTVHNVILFPCADEGCERKAPGFKPMQEACLPGSTKHVPKVRPVVLQT